MCDLLREHAPKVALRGSSMGGFTRDPRRGAGSVGGRRGGDVPRAGGAAAARSAVGPAAGVPLDAAATEPWLEGLDLFEAAAALGEATALLLLHAKGDEQVPYTVSEELHEAAHEPKRLLVFPGGHHRSLQHDLEVQNLSARFIERALDAPRRRPSGDVRDLHVRLSP